MGKTNIYVTLTDTPKWEKEREIDNIDYLYYKANECARVIKKAVANKVDEEIIKELERYWRTVLNKDCMEAVVAFKKKYNENYFDTEYFKKKQEEKNNE